MLEKYRDMLTEVRDGKLIKRAVRIVISGDRPVAAISRVKNRLVGIDGRLSDLDSSKPAHLMPMISDRWSSHFKWRGEGTMPKEERKKLEEERARLAQPVAEDAKWYWEVRPVWKSNFGRP